MSMSVRSTAIRKIHYDPKAQYEHREAEFKKICEETNSAIDAFNVWIKEKTNSENRYYLLNSYEIDEKPIAHFFFAFHERKPEEWHYYHSYSKKLLETLMLFGDVVFPSAQAKSENSALIPDIYKPLAEDIWSESMKLTLALFNDDSYPEEYAALLIVNLEAALELMKKPGDFTAMQRVVAAMDNIHATITGNIFLHTLRSSKYAENFKKLFERLFLILSALFFLSTIICCCCNPKFFSPDLVVVPFFISLLSSFISGIAALTSIGLASLFNNSQIIPHVEKINASVTELAKKIDPAGFTEANKHWYEKLNKYVPSFFYARDEANKKEPVPNLKPTN